MFFHFGINTFTDRETGTGYDDPSIFNPHGLDARQWVREAKNAGFKIVILTAKHADGFCLWPTAYTDYSVKASPWKNGTGDVVREVADAAKEQGLEFGLYLSPWDRHEATYGDTMLYNEFYLAQMRELLTMYGPISEVFLDGNKGTETRDMVYLFPTWFALIHQLQPNANIFSDAGPDVRWVGDETGEAGVTSWSMINSTTVTIGGAEQAYLNEGDISGLDWVPPECDVSIRPGWFWHKYQQPRSVETLLDIYFKSVGRNCVMLLNTPPNSTGLLHDTDVKILQEFKSTIEAIFSQNLASKARISASSTRGSEATSVENSPFRPEQVLTDDLNEYWAVEDGLSSGHLQLDLGANVTFNVVKIQEAVNMGQRVKKYHVDVWQGASWHTVVHGTTIGYKKLDRITLTSTQLVRLVIDDARAQPLIASFGLYLDARTKVTCGGSNSTCLSSPTVKTVSVI
jgi:alpha-L-fucosidase